MSTQNKDHKENYLDWLNKNCLPVQETLQLSSAELKKIKVFLESTLDQHSSEIKIISLESATQYELENFLNNNAKVIKLRFSRKRCHIYVDEPGLIIFKEYVNLFKEQLIIEGIDAADTRDFGTLNKITLEGGLQCLAPIIKLEACLQDLRVIAYIYFDPSLLRHLAKNRLNSQQRIFDNLRINSKLVFRAQLKNICAFNQLIPGRIIPLDSSAQLNISNPNENISVMISQDNQRQFNLKRAGVSDAAL